MPSDGKGGQRESKVRVRAHFEYSPENDPYIPCKVQIKYLIAILKYCID